MQQKIQNTGKTPVKKKNNMENYFIFIQYIVHYIYRFFFDSESAHYVINLIQISN